MMTRLFGEPKSRGLTGEEELVSAVVTLLGDGLDKLSLILLERE